MRYVSEDKKIKIRKFVHNRHFSSICTDSILDFKDCPTNYSLKNIYCSHSPRNADHIDFSHTNVSDAFTVGGRHLSFERPIFSGDWYESYRLIYGPYPTPPNDQKPFLSKDELESISNIYPLPDEVDNKLASWLIIVSLFGAAIGDSLGMYCESRETPDINFFNDQPLDITWTHPYTFRYGRFLHRGAFTDDTAMILIFLRSVVSTAVQKISAKQGKLHFIFDPREAAKRIHHWINFGIDEHLDDHGYGRGSFTTSVVNSDNYENDPIKASQNAWEEGGRSRASNGGIMRTAGCGCFLFWDEEKVIEISRRFCQCTHYDPRCVFSSVLISLFISRLIQWRCGLIENFDLDHKIDEVKYILTRKNQKQSGFEDCDYIENFNEIEIFLTANDLSEIDLFDKNIRTLSTMACGIWVLRKNFTYSEGIENVIRAGGDTDTNAAVAGAVLGAKLGFSGIPLHLTDFLWYGGYLYREAVPFLKMMGMDFKPPTYDDILTYKFY